MSAIVIWIAFALVGWVAVSTIRPSDAGPVRESGLRRLTAVALALGLGSTFTAASLLVPNAAAAAVLAILTAMVITVRRDAMDPPYERVPPIVVASSRPRRALVVLTCVAILVAGIVVVAGLARRPDGEWDAYAIWNLRARLLVREPGDPSMVSIGGHGDYPLLLPGLIASGWSLTGDGAAWVSGAVAWLFGALAVAAIASSIAPRRGSTFACLGVLAYLAMPRVLDYASWRYADIPLSAFVVLAIGWLASAYERPARARSALALAGVCASLAASTKNEGAVHVAAIALVLCLRPPASLTRRRSVACYLGGALPFLAVLVAYKIGLAPASEYGSAIRPSSLSDRLGDGSRWGTIAGHVVSELSQSSHWNYLLPGAMLLTGFLPRRRSADVPVARAVGLAAIAYFGVYLVTPHPLAWQLQYSLDRLLLQLCPALLVAVALRIAPAMPPSP